MVALHEHSTAHRRVRRPGSSEAAVAQCAGRAARPSSASAGRAATDHEPESADQRHEAEHVVEQRRGSSRPGGSRRSTFTRPASSSSRRAELNTSSARSQCIAAMVAAAPVARPRCACVSLRPVGHAPQARSSEDPADLRSRSREVERSRMPSGQRAEPARRPSTCRRRSSVARQLLVAPSATARVGDPRRRATSWPEQAGGSSSVSSTGARIRPATAPGGPPRSRDRTRPAASMPTTSTPSVEASPATAPSIAMRWSPLRVDRAALER